MKLESKYHRWAPLTVLLAALLVTTVVTWQFWRMLQASDWTRFQSYILPIKDRMVERMEGTITLLRGGAGLFAANPEVTREGFRAYVERLRLNQYYPEILGIGWTRRIAPTEKDDVVQAMRTQGQETFHIWPEYERDEYYAIVYLEPLNQRNQAAIGYDMFTEPVRRTAMEHARDNGATISGKVTLVQEIDDHKQAGFLIYLPVYRDGSMPATVAERRDKLLGFIYSPLRAGDWISRVVTSGDPKVPISIAVFDGTEIKPEALLYSSAPDPMTAARRSHFSEQVPLHMAGRSWTLLFTTRPQFDRPTDAYLVPGVFLSGALISFLLAGITGIQTWARQAADESALQLRHSQQELQQAAKALQSSQERLHLALEAARMAVWELDIATGRLEESGEMGPLFGRSRGSLHDNLQTLLDDIHPDDHESVKHTLLQSSADGSDYEIESRLIWPDGSVHWLVIRGEVICDTAGRPASMIGVALDATQLKQAQEALREADARKNIFLATLAHELRNPLAAISNSLHIMKLAGADGRMLQKAQTTAERQLGHLVRMVDDLLDIARIVQGKIKLQQERVELTAIIDHAVDACHALIAAAGHELTVTLPSQPLYLEADATRLSQVVTNLLNNAAKYTPAKGHIWLTAGQEGGQAVVRVRDTGIGISATMLPHVFDMFSQADTTLDHAQSGLGIGLAMVKNLVQLHQGSVEVYSAGPGQGSEFVVRLPLIATAQARSTEEPSRPGAVPVRRVLVVDDNQDSAESIAMLLQLQGHQVEFAFDGPSALEKAVGFQPDLVLLDLGLPGMDGYEVARRLRPRLPHTILAAMTGWSSSEHRARSNEAGFDYHLVKPLDLAVLDTLLAGPPRAAIHSPLADAEIAESARHV
ncbi:MAG: CHASE domain-containing protein [Candidatus Competibacteraceae bacterium]